MTKKTINLTRSILPSMFPKPDITKPEIRELLEMHTYCRPAGGKTVGAFCAKYLDKMPGMKKDRVGNRYLRIGTAPVLWSSHTDTVHTRDGMQRLAYGDGILTTASEETSGCLGADDSAGVWIMRQMALNNVPGLYIWHAAEEVGGIGSAYIRDHAPAILDGIDYAIALDRKGLSSVITHQWTRCCSDSFAESLANQIGREFAPDDGGTFTDTAHYIGLVPECTNLSVGYFGAHSQSESLDIGFVVWLLERLCQLDVSSLPVSRNVDDVIYDEQSDHFCRMDMENLVYESPEAAAQLLMDLGATPEVLQEYIRSTRKWGRR